MRSETKAARTRKRLKAQRARSKELERKREYKRLTAGNGRFETNTDAIVAANPDDENNGIAAMYSDHGKGADAIRSFDERTPEALAKSEAENEARELALDKADRRKYEQTMDELRQCGKAHLCPTLKIIVKNRNLPTEEKRECNILTMALQLRNQRSARQTGTRRKSDTNAT